MTTFYSVFNRTNAGEEALKKAMTQIGVPYLWGGTDWNVGLDCSGLTLESYLRVGVTLPRTTFTQCKLYSLAHGTPLLPGDLLFIAGSDGSMSAPGHVMMYHSPGKIVQAPFTGEDVQLVNYDTTQYVVATRPANHYGAPVKPPVPSDLFANGVVQVTGPEALIALKNGWVVRGWDGEHFLALPLQGIPAGVVKYASLDWAKKRQPTSTAA